MDFGMDDQVLMGMGIESVRVQEGYFRPHYAQEVRGNRLLLDPSGGCGF